MTNKQQTLTTPEEKTGKTTLLLTAMALAALMVSAVVGGAAFVIYQQFSAMPTGTQASASRSQRTLPLAPLAQTQGQLDVAPGRSDYRQVDNATVLPPAAARRVIAAWKSNPVIANVPPPLMKTNEEVAQESGNRPPLSDPESKYIVSATTGRVVGVDGTVGAAADARRQQAIPVAKAVQTPMPEVRVAVPVQVRAAVPVVPGDEEAYPQDNSYAASASYVPVRRAQPAGGNGSFSAASYLSSGNDLPVVRGQVVNPTSRAAGYSQDFRLPDRASRF